MAWAIVAAYIAFTDGPDRQASAGMYAFGDSLLFVAVFGVAAVPATGAALYFVRPVPAFWRVLSVAAIAITATGVAAVGMYFAARISGAGALLQSWSTYAVLRILMAPLVAVAFLLCGAFAPLRPAKRILWCATFVEAAGFASVVLTWLILHLTGA